MGNDQKPYPELETDGISEKVKKAVRNLPREQFVSKELEWEAYNDYPLSIDCGQTISQPSLVGYMTEKLELKETDRVLEIGTGSGFQTAVLAQLVKEVYTVEVYPQLLEKAEKLLTKLGYKNINYRVGDGKNGWIGRFAFVLPPFFDKIIVTATAKEIPPALPLQLKVGGKMILPLGKESDEWLILVEKTSETEISQKTLIPIRFVPLL